MCRHNGLHFFIVRLLGSIGNFGLVGGNGTHTVIVGCQELASVVLCISIVGVQIGDTAVFAIGGTPKRAGQQAGGVQLRRAQSHIVDAVAGIGQVDQVAPLKVTDHDTGVTFQRLINVKLFGYSTVRFGEGNLQCAIGRQCGGDVTGLRRARQGNPSVGGCYNNSCGNHKHEQCTKDLLLHMGKFFHICTYSVSGFVGHFPSPRQNGCVRATRPRSFYGLVCFFARRSRSRASCSSRRRRNSPMYALRSSLCWFSVCSK